MNSPTVTPVPVPEPLPVTHHAHPIWSGFSWPVLLQVIQVAATVAPVVVAITDAKDPAAVAEAEQLSKLTNAVIQKLQTPGA